MTEAKADKIVLQHKQTEGKVTLWNIPLLFY